ncbi:MAG: hypothetical protein ACWA40_04020 [Planktomarina sp.]
MANQNNGVFQMTCVMARDHLGYPQMTELSLTADHLSIHFQSAMGASQTFGLRQDLVDFLVQIDNRCASRVAKGFGDIAAENFVARVGNVQLENLAVTLDENGNSQISLRVICARHLDLFQSDENEKNLDCFEEIFLPLTNLSAYLHAMEAQPSSQGPRQAARLTAERIDEFLLQYGQRLQDGLWGQFGKGGYK